MGLLDHPEIVEHLRRIVRYGCLEYRKVFEAAGLECGGGRGTPGAGPAAHPAEVFHEFILYLEGKGVDLDGVIFWRAYLIKVFKSFAEDLRREIEREGLLYGNVETDGALEGERGDACASMVGRAARRRAFDTAGHGRAHGEPECPEALNRLTGLSSRDQLNCFLQNYPLVRDSDFYMNRLRVLYRDAFGADFPEDEADRLWESQRGGDCAQVYRRLEGVRIALCDLRRKLSEALSVSDGEAAGAITVRIAALRSREAELRDRHAYLLRLKPAHIIQILPARHRPTLNALTVALHRTRTRLNACG